MRLGLFLYDHLGGRKHLAADPRASTRPRTPVGRPLEAGISTSAFEYSDCWVDDARLVVLNALDAEEARRQILTRTAVTGGRRNGETWEVELRDRHTARRASVKRAASSMRRGPGSSRSAGPRRAPASRRVRLVKGSHIVVPKHSGRATRPICSRTPTSGSIFVNPYEGDLALIGTTDISVEGKPEDAADRQPRDRLSAERR